MQYVKGVGPRIARLLANKGISTVGDLFNFLPRSYEDRRRITPVGGIRADQHCICVGRIEAAETPPTTFQQKKIFSVVLADGTGRVSAKWFGSHGRWLEEALAVGNSVIMAGKPRWFRSGMELIHPDFEVIDDHEKKDSLHFNRIVPIYSTTEGLYQKRIRRIIDNALCDYLDAVTEIIPDNLLKQQELISLRQAIKQAHQPSSDTNIDRLLNMRSEAHRRLVFDEFFLLSFGLLLKRRWVKAKAGIVMDVDAAVIRKMLEGLPFTLTTAQRRTLRDVWEDMKKPSPMQRLIQGDVGSGKTVVALVAAGAAARAGCQTALMAPTEILAEQHYKSTLELSEALGLRTALLTSSTKAMDRTRLLRATKIGQLDLLIGTHALIQDDVDFARLGLVVIDEQHRFGVEQRETLRRKGTRPDMLVMTATPIPRSLAMTLYGDLDLSIIDELPPGRQEVATSVISQRSSQKVWSAVRQELKKGHQAFIVYPLVEESENLDLRDATRMHKQLSIKEFPDYSVGLLHGRMKSAEKEQAMNSFRSGETSLLVSTTVVEVGVDVANATMIVIEHAERFGLTQLHQLRGRVGRNENRAYCLLVVGDAAGAEAQKRLSVMEKTSDGFRIAEEDLALRGPGQFMGTRQSGAPEFYVANLARDVDVLALASKSAKDFLDSTLDLTRSPVPELIDQVKTRWGGRIELASTG